ncbi:MAG: TatD family deoxyribonuclease [Chloroflexi bacterium]|nr:MAG: TatD family deoxyribonuclease [Chloroflexota bacterium]TMG70431.1 MAG: TatD family deoxyribonuclease [Chloroflexota bacterium]
MIDAHAHLTDGRFANDLSDTLARARKAGVIRVLSAAEDLASSEAAVTLARAHAEVRVAVGVHPHRAESWNGDALVRLTQLARDEHVVAIGEIGMDLSGRSAPLEAQEQALRGQLAVASLLDLPVVLHVRDAGDRIRAILREGPEVRGMVHCYSEGPDEIASWLELGFSISFAGTITYPANEPLRAAAGRTPLESLLAETDSPYLAPQNVRGQRNEPRYVAATYAALSHERRVDLGELAARVAENAKRLFGERWREPSSAA